METEKYYVLKIKERLSIRQKENPQYSLRAFSRDLGIHASTLNHVLRGKREVPFKKIHDVASNLSLNNKEKTLFFESFYSTKTKLDQIQVNPQREQMMIDESHFQIIAEWEHCAVLELFGLSNYKVNMNNIQKKLGLSKSRVEVVIHNLLKSNLLKVNAKGEYERVHEYLRTTNDISSQALKKSHKETLTMGIHKIEDIETHLRDFSATVLAVAPNKIPEVKTIIREFRQKVTELLRDGEKEEVYRLAIQFYPLSIKEKKNEF